MNDSVQKDGQKQIVSAEGELTIYRAQELKEHWLSVLNSCGEMDINLRNVTYLDSAGVQVLMSLKVEACNRQKILRLVDHSAPVIDIFELLNAASYFGDPILLPSNAYRGQHQGGKDESGV